MRPTLSVLTLVLALALTGCLKADSKTVVKADGSGTYQQVTVLELEKAFAYQKMLVAKARNLGIPEEPDENPFASVDAKERAKELDGRRGIQIVGSKATDDAKTKTRRYELSLKFDSLLDLYEAGVIEDTTIKLAQAEDKKSWTLTIRHIFDGNDNDLPEGPALEQLKRVRKQLLDSVKAWWDTVAIQRTLTLPTKVLKTNGTKSEDGKSVTWKLTFEDLADPKNLLQQVTFEHTEALKLKPFELTANDVENAREAFEMEREERQAREREKK